jgi:hypothetical protein
VLYYSLSLVATTELRYVVTVPYLNPDKFITLYTVYQCTPINLIHVVSYCGDVVTYTYFIIYTMERRGHTSYIPTTIYSNVYTLTYYICVCIVYYSECITSERCVMHYYIYMLHRCITSYDKYARNRGCATG